MRSGTKTARTMERLPRRSIYGTMSGAEWAFSWRPYLPRDAETVSWLVHHEGCLSLSEQKHALNPSVFPLTEELFCAYLSVHSGCQRGVAIIPGFSARARREASPCGPAWPKKGCGDFMRRKRIPTHRMGLLATQCHQPSTLSQPSGAPTSIHPARSGAWRCFQTGNQYTG